MVWGILPCLARLSRFLPKVSLFCQLCSTTGNRVYFLFSCTGNKETPVLLIKVLKSYDLEVTPSKVLTLDVNLESHMEIPLVGIIATPLSTIWTQRQKGRVCAAKTRTQLKPRCRMLREGNSTTLQNAATLQTSPYKQCLLKKQHRRTQGQEPHSNISLICVFLDLIAWNIRQRNMMT